MAVSCFALLRRRAGLDRFSHPLARAPRSGPASCGRALAASPQPRLGLESPTERSAATTPCGAGKGGPTCQPCAKGYYSTGGTVAQPLRACTQCTGGTSTATTGSTSAAACTGGDLALAARGRAIPACSGSRASTSQAASGERRRESLRRPCALTPATPHPPNLRTKTVTICAPGKNGVSGCASNCPAGSYSVGGTLAVPQPPCTQCGAGLGSPAGSTSAAACLGESCAWVKVEQLPPEASGSMGLSHAACARRCAFAPAAICPAGKGGAGCALCPRGSWSAGGTTAQPQKACADCTGGNSTAATGSDAAADCNGAARGPASALLYPLGTEGVRAGTASMQPIAPAAGPLRPGRLLWAVAFFFWTPLSRPTPGTAAAARLAHSQHLLRWQERRGGVRLRMPRWQVLAGRHPEEPPARVPGVPHGHGIRCGL